jgi:hypothetical protein
MVFSLVGLLGVHVRKKQTNEQTNEQTNKQTQKQQQPDIVGTMCSSL